ncbi:MAG: preprotein translocase subunit SecE [Patescibacteria group bacterium]|nr:preprotein translocase subunit SecE [Patescibacteria group bacterium]
MWKNLNNYLTESREEFGRVSWLSRAEAIRLVIVVTVITAAVAAYLGLLDSIFLGLIRKFILKH